MEYAVFKQFGKKPGRIAHERMKINGRTFDSRAEYERWMELCVLEKQGVITDLKEHPQFEIIPRQIGRDGNTVFRPARYTADFSYRKDGELIVEDVKSEYTRQE